MTIYNQPMVVSKQGGFLENNFNIITGTSAPTGALKRPVGTFFVLQNPPAIPTIYASGGIVNNLGVWVLLGGTASDLNTLQGNLGGVINPVSGNINILGSGDLTVSGTAGTLTISNSSQFEATVSTTDATVTTIYTIPLGATAGTVSFDVDVFCFNSSGPKGGSFNLFGAARTDGTTGTIIGVNSSLNVVDGAFAVSATVTASANTALVRVTGLALTNINWKCNGFYRKVT